MTSDLEAAGHAGLDLADAGEQARPGRQAEQRVDRALVAELRVDHLAVAAGAVAVAGEAAAARQQHGRGGGDAGLRRAADDDAAARVDGAEPRPVVHGRARARPTCVSTTPASTSACCCAIAAERAPGAVVAAAGHGRISTATPPRRTCSTSASETSPPRISGLTGEKARSIGYTPSRAVGAGDGLRHLLQVQRLERMRDARAADGLVGLVREDEVRVQRLEQVGHVLRLPERRDLLLVHEVVHDARREHLVAQRGAAAGAACAGRRRRAAPPRLCT